MVALPVSESLSFIPAVQQQAFNPLGQALTLLEEFGFFQVVVPMILVFSIFYGVLLRIQLFGNPQDVDKQPWVKPVSSIVSLAAAFLVVSSTDVVRNISTLVPQAAFLLVGAVLLLMVFGISGVFNTERGFLDQRNKLSGLGMIVLGVIVFLFLALIDVAYGFQIPIVHQLVLATVGVTPSGDPVSGDLVSSVLGLLIAFGIPVAIIYWMTKGGVSGDSN